MRTVCYRRKCKYEAVIIGFSIESVFGAFDISMQRSLLFKCHFVRSS